MKDFHELVGSLIDDPLTAQPILILILYQQYFLI